ncbi:hypothetical protein ACFFRR_009251 [Megaselia abdita]
MQFFKVFLIFYTIKCCVASDEIIDNDLTEEVKCGPQLTNFMIDFCRKHTESKKSMTVYNDDPQISSSLDNDEDSSISVFDNYVYTMANNRRRRQIIRDCCNKHCTIQKLKSYCGSYE